MDPLPTGTVTMLFSDIEASTSLVNRLGDRYGEALSLQRRIMRKAIGDCSGREMGTEGDSFFVVFESAHQAVSCCLQAQRALTEARWPGDVAVRVRMGVHTGEPIRHEDGYVGADVYRAARIAASAHGGQIVVSATTRQLAGGQLPAGAELTDLGWHRLKDLAEPERIHQLTAPGLAAVFPPLKSLGAQSRLPSPATPLVGRDADLSELLDMVGVRGVRLVTLTGPGGVGKTRLALALAAALTTTFRDGVYFASLDAVSNVDVLWKVVADSLGITLEAAPAVTVPAHLADRRAMLVLDNVEQLAEAAGAVGELVRAAPGLVVLVTSRRPLHLQDECEYAVPPLAQPSGEDVEAVGRSDAVRLFVQQAAAVRRGFALTEANAVDIAAICRRLDGLPLAIELAASRVRLLPPKALLTRLGDSLDLAATDIDRPGRQQTLRATIAWSHRLLSPDRQRVFRRMGVFVGGCDLDAVQAVALGEEDGSAVAGDDALMAMTDLLDDSLVTVVETPEGDVRVTMLETIRDYAYDELRRSGDLEMTQRRHAEYYAAFAEQAKGELTGPNPLIWLDRLDVEHGNLRAAVSWALDTPDVSVERSELGLRMVDALRNFWSLRSHTDQARRWLELAVTHFRAADRTQLSGVLHSLGWLLLHQGETEQAKALLEEHLALARRNGNPMKVSGGQISLSAVYVYLDQLDTARALLGESLALARELGQDAHTATALVHLGYAEMVDGRAERAVELMTEAVERAGRARETATLTWSRHNLAAAITRAGRPEEAHPLLGSVVDDIVRLGNKELIADTLDIYAEGAARVGADRRAARLVGAVDQLREQSGLRRLAPDERLVESSLAPLRGRVPAETWQAEYAAGRRLSQREALALAASPLPAQADRADA